MREVYHMSIKEVGDSTPSQLAAIESGRSKIHFKRKYGGKK
jgi:hypothetical protein